MRHANVLIMYTVVLLLITVSELHSELHSLLLSFHSLLISIYSCATDLDAVECGAAKGHQNFEIQDD